MNLHPEQRDRLSLMCGEAARTMLLAHGAQDIEAYELLVEKAAQKLAYLHGTINAIKEEGERPVIVVPPGGIITP